MRTENLVTIYGSVDRVFALAADVLHWPEIAPHYRQVRLLSCDGRSCVVEMSAHRDGIPVKWRSKQLTIPEERRILFRHISGPTAGMEVEWRMWEEQGRSGPATQVSVMHLFTAPCPLVGPFGPFFVHDIAGKTLAALKRVVEGEAGAGGVRAAAPRSRDRFPVPRA